MMHSHLHGGKWSQEEEMYASALIDAFKAGELPSDDIEEGTSLRKYLAKKLMCSPKRISKKYEGSNYNGKQVYFRNKRVNNDLVSKAKLQILENNFLRTLSETKLIGTQGPLSVPAPSATSELQMMSPLQMQDLNDTSRSMASNFFNPQHPTPVQAGLSSAWMPQNLAQARMHNLERQINQLGTSLMSGIQGGSNQLGPMAPGTGLPIPQLTQDQNFVRLASRMSASNQLPLPSTGEFNFHSISSLATPASRSLLHAAQLQQLERTITSRTHGNVLDNNSSAADQTTLEALRRSLIERQSTIQDRLVAASGGRPSMLDYLTDPMARSRMEATASTTDLLRDAANAQIYRSNQQEQQVLDNLNMGRSRVAANLAADVVASATTAQLLFQQHQQEQAMFATIQRENPYQLPQLTASAGNRAAADGINFSSGGTASFKRDHNDSSSSGSEDRGTIRGSKRFRPT